MYKLFKASYPGKSKSSVFAIELSNNDMVCIYHIKGTLPYGSDLLNAFMQMNLHKQYKNRKNPYSIIGKTGTTGHLYLNLVSFIGVYNEDPAEMPIKNAPIYGDVYIGNGIYETKEKFEFNSSGKVDPSFIGVERSYWISDIIEFLIYSVDMFGSTESEIKEIKEDTMVIIDNKTINSELLERVINGLLFEEEDDEEDESDEE